MISSMTMNQRSSLLSRSFLKTRRYYGEITLQPPRRTRPRQVSRLPSSCRTLSNKPSSASSNSVSAAERIITLTESQKAALAQRRAYEYYRQKHGLPTNKNNRQSTSSSESSINERNVKIAWYAAATVVGALGATYAAVPLYKIFCQTTGFGGTTQRVKLSDWAESKEARESSGRGKVSQALWDKLIGMSNVPLEMLPVGGGGGTTSHGRGAKTWTDEEAAEKLASLRPRKDGQLITVRFDSTVGDVLPWSFVPAQLDVKVVPGETALSFFTATNHSDKAITGVATYNVHPPKVGLYFNKIQCFCFEEQRLLPGETVDMPVFFFIDPDIIDDPQLKHVTVSSSCSYHESL